MQKKLIAVAIAGLMSGAAFAQSNVTISGLVEAGYTHGSGNGMKGTGINSGVNDGSRIIFSGNEALGNGVTALFRLEYQLAVDRNAGISAARQQFIGLSGASGTVVAGRLTAPGDGVFTAYDAMDQSNTFSPLATLTGNSGSGTQYLAGNGTTLGAFLNNAAAYVSPTMGGFTFVGAYSFAGYQSSDSVAYSSGQERVLGLRATYENGPLSIGYAHHRANDVAAAGSGVDARENVIGGSYDFGAAKLMATYQTGKVNVTSTNDKVWSLGATVPMGKNLLRVSYASADIDAANADSTGWGIRYDYNLSKRTMVFAGYTHISNDSAATSANNALAGGAVLGDGNSGYGFGIAHSF